MKRDFPHRSRPSGFTLVEVLVVLGILVLLASLVVPRVLSGQKKANIDATKAQIGAFRGALERYAVDCKDFPTTEEGLWALLEPPADLAETVVWAGPYLNGDIPLDPWGFEYQYEYPASRGMSDYPDIWSVGPDGEDDTEDDICSWNRDAAMGGGEALQPGTGGRSSRSSAPAPIRNPAPVNIN